MPIVGLPLFLLLGSSRVNARRHRIQAEANRELDDGLAHLPTVPPEADLPASLVSIMTLNRQLTSLPCVPGSVEEVLTDYRPMMADIAAAIDGARRYVHVEMYIAAWDGVSESSSPRWPAPGSAGSRCGCSSTTWGRGAIAEFGSMRRRLDDMGLDWHLMLPIDPLRRRWRRLDLRNHRKIIVIDGRTAYLGSLNLIGPHYLSARNARIGRQWRETVVRLSGPIVGPVESVFAVDWYTESGEELPAERYFETFEPLLIGGSCNALQVVPSGPGYPTQPNLRLFTSLIHRAQRELLIVSPYFVPDEAILEAVTTAAHRGVRVELFVGEKADQFMVQYAQSSYYRVLLEAGVRIHRYPAPYVLHSKFLTLDDEVAVIGSSNMDLRSFNLNYEISLMGAGGDLPRRLREVAAGYRESSAELSLAQWEARPLYVRYLENVLRLTSALQ